MESRDEILTRHRREVKECIAGNTALKKAVAKSDKQKRKQVVAEIALRDAILAKRHEEELAGTKDTIDEEQTQAIEAEFDDLSINSPTTSERKHNRNKARMARRTAAIDAMRAEAANEAAHEPDRAKIESEKMRELLSKQKLIEKPIRPDGHCLYAAFADQLNVNRLLTPESDYQTMRSVAASYILAHADDFAPFIEDDIRAYATEIEKTAIWGGELEILALSKEYNVSSQVYTASQAEPLIINESASNGVVHLAYYQHMYGLGAHYNSVMSAG